MSLTRFAGICDRCGKRSEEYSRWPECRSCELDICSDCQAPDSEDMDYRSYTALCAAGCVEPDDQ